MSPPLRKILATVLAQRPQAKEAPAGILRCLRDNVEGASRPRLPLKGGRLVCAGKHEKCDSKAAHKKIDTLDRLLFIKLARSIEQLKSVLRRSSTHLPQMLVYIFRKHTNRMKGNKKRARTKEKRNQHRA